MAFLANSNPYAMDITAFPADVVRLDITDRVKGYDPGAPGTTGKANEQAKTLNERDNHLLDRLVVIEELLAGLDTDTLAALDLVTVTMENKRQEVTVASGDTAKTIDLADGAIVSISLNNTAPCTFTFGSMRQCLSGELILTAVGADRTFILPATWQPTEISRTIVVRSGTKRILAFECEQVAVGGGSPLPEIVIASSLSEALLTT